MPADRNTKVLSKNFGVEGANTIDGALGRGAYRTFLKAFAMPRPALVEEVKKSNLRGRGGAGFPTGLKWSFVPKGEDAYLVVNADESEPGTCKDRELIYWDPHQLIEGVMIGAYALGSKHSYIYIRGEMIREAEVLQRAVDEAYARGYLGRVHPCHGGGQFSVDLTVHRGAGAYICGEETSLLNSLEGKRGWPRVKPPFPAVRGLFGQPTIVNNVETIANLPAIVEQGGQWFAELGTGRSGGMHLVSVSGHVARPGVYELPMSMTVREIIYDVCGGIWQGRNLKGVIPGGSSTPVMLPDEIDVPFEFDALASDTKIRPVEVRPGVLFDMGGGKVLRTQAGSGAMIVMDDSTDMVAACARLMYFYAHESCGQCTPCREGTGWLNRVVNRMAKGQGRSGDTDLCASIAAGIAGNTICPLGDAAAWPMLAFLTKFRAEFEARENRAQAPGKETRA